MNYPIPYTRLLRAGIACLAFVALTAASHQGCSRKTSYREGPPAPAREGRSIDFLQQKMEQKERSLKNIQSLSARIKLLSESPDMTIAATGNIIWIRDSIIWVNVKKFGFEALRALVTRDSVFILNRMEKTASADALESLRIEYNLPDGDVFDHLQKTLLGLPLIPKGGKLSSDIAEEKHRIRGEYDLFSAEYKIEEGSFSLKNEWFLRKKDQSLIALYFDRHQKIEGNGALFPYFRRIETAGPETGTQTADLEFEDIQINTNPSFRFEIPGHYSKGK